LPVASQAVAGVNHFHFEDRSADHFDRWCIRPLVHSAAGAFGILARLVRYPRLPLSSRTMPRLGFAIDNRACIGCHACTVACKSEHEVPIGVNRTWVKYIEKGEFPNARRSFSVQRCNHCDDAPCVAICPVTSLFRRPDGIVDFDPQRCIGCKACMQACPYDALYLDPGTLTAAKCNYCAHRIESGLEPACVVVCPVEAIVSGDLDDPNSRIAQLDRTQRVQYPKVEKGTRPKLFYVGGETAALDPGAAPPVDQYLWSADRGITPGALARAADEEAQTRARRVYDVNRKPAPWDWRVSAYVTTKAIATGTTLMAFILFLLGELPALLPPPAALVSLLFIGLTGVFLVADLKQPQRFLYVLLRPQWRSWLVRGAYLITGYAALLPLCALLSWLSAPLGVQTALGWVLNVLAAGVAAYTAFLFAQAKGRDYWQNPVLVPVMLVDALACGVAAFLVLDTLGWPMGLGGGAGRLALSLCIGAMALLLVAEFVPTHQTRNAERTAHLILRGSLATLFYLSLGLGVLVPAAGLALGAPPAGCALAMVIGIVLKNHVLVQAPQRVPLS